MARTIEGLLATLNPEQRLAVETTDGPVLVLAGAGSGKTRVITVRIAYLVSRGVPANRILAVTFTNKAAAEMRERIGRLLPEGAAEGLLVSTFHSFGLWMLRKSAAWLPRLAGASIIDESDREAMLTQIRQELAITDKDLTADEIAAFLMQVKGCGAKPDVVASSHGYKKATLLRQFLQNYQERLALSRCLDFDDLILKPVELLESKPDVRRFFGSLFHYVMVDEYQDTNWLQFRLLQLLCGEKPNLCVVGDDDQSIYGWRGARVENILEFDRHFPGCRVVKLTRNYRSEKNILQLANAVIAKNVRRHGKELWTENDKQVPVRKLLFDNQQEEATRIGQAVRTFIGGGLTAGKIAVLYRTRGQARILQEAFRVLGIPYKVIGSFDFFERKEVRDILAYLRLAVNPRSEASFRRIINYPTRGVGLATLKRIEECRGPDMTLLEATRVVASQAGDGAAARSRRALADFVSTIERFHAAFASERGEAVADRVLEYLTETGVREDLTVRGPSSARALQVILAMLTRCLTERYVRSLAEFLERVALDEKEADFNPEGEAAETTTLMTVHAAKGLEFDAVFVAGLVEGLFPHFRSVNDAGGLEEERRLFYVALTRSRKHLVLSHFRFREERGEVRPCRPSRFLSELPQDLLSSDERFANAPVSKEALIASLDALGELMSKK
jgi:DNA helicase-2/ATP-dependent DNA helicase PcrA